MYSVKMKGIPPPSCQIHHMGTDHWIPSVQDTEDDQVILFDSSQGFSPRLSRSLEMQLFAVYPRGKRHLQVVHPRVQQQHNDVDCGIFAIAYTTEFVFNQYTGNELEFDRFISDFIFDLTAAGVVPCGGRKTSPRTSTIVQFIFYFGPLRSAIIF